ncbi:MAG: hypothetical protein ACPGQL_08550 [Thermoplasmatota archaeon]
MLKRFKLDQQAIGQVTVLIVAGVIFAAAAGTTLVFLDEHSRHTTVEGPVTQAEADALAQRLAATAGDGWASGVDSLQRLGLGAPNGSGLDLDHMLLLSGAAYNASANGLLDYAEAEASLGISDRDFHLRVYPIGVEDELVSDSLAGLRIGYIGDWDALASVTVSLGTDAAMKAEAEAQLSLDMGAGTANERQILDDLGLDFKDNVHITLATPTVLVDLDPLPDLPLLDVLGVTLVEGDVYPDNKQYLNQVLAGRLSEYDVLFVGSTVDHSSLTSNVVKDAIADWVELEGGTLMVMGSASQNYQWLQPIFQVGTDTVSGGAYAPDLGHPMLHEPYTLDWTGYNNFGLGWDIKQNGAKAHFDDFEHVVMEDGEDLLASSGDGVFGDGRVILTTYRPTDIMDQMNQTEAGNFVTNMLLYAAFDHLYLEYGPLVPDDRTVAVAVRHSHAWDTDLGWVPLRMELRLWRAVD